MITREFHITYCSICKNMKFNPKVGLECGLTGVIADFDPHCKDYDEDLVELEKIKKNLLKKIERSYHLTRLEGFIGDKNMDTYEEVYHFEEEILTNAQPVPNIIKGRDKVPIYFLIASVVASFFINYRWLLGNGFELSPVFIIVSTFQFLLLIVVINLLKDDKIYFKATDRYFELNEQRVYYNDIITLGQATGNEKIPRTDLVVGTKSKGLVQLNLHRVDINVLELVEIVRHARV